jgi:outer membrane lipoprotein-sorting protein
MTSNVAIPTIYMMNHETSWFYQGALEGTKEKATVKVASAIPLPIMMAFDSFKEGLDNPKYFTRTNNGFNIVLKSKSDFIEESHIKQIELRNSFRHSLKTLSDVKTLILTDVDDKQTTYEFSDFKEEKLDKAYFVFQIPKDTKVIKD